MKTSVNMLFALLRAALHEKETETAFFAEACADDWNECYLLAKAQGVTALAWDGVMRLPAHLQPYLDLKLQWGFQVENLEKVYGHYCKAICEISSFFKEHGIATMMLKGVGLSTLYPVPAHREGGAWTSIPIRTAKP